MTPLDLFSPENMRRVMPATHRDALPTEHEAAARVSRKLGALHDAVLAAFAECGPMHARKAEELEQFAHLGASTIRKRISELYQAGRLEAFGKRDGLTVWRLATTTTPRQTEETT